MAESQIDFYLFKNYCVVQIYSNELKKTVFPAVPSVWLNEESECNFPADLNCSSRALKKAIERCLPPEEDWPTFPAIILTASDDFGQVLRRANRAVAKIGASVDPSADGRPTNIETDVEQKRQRKGNSWYAADEYHQDKSVKVSKAGEKNLPQCSKTSKPSSKFASSSRASKGTVAGTSNSPTGPSPTRKNTSPPAPSPPAPSPPAQSPSSGRKKSSSSPWNNTPSPKNTVSPQVSRKKRRSFSPEVTPKRPLSRRNVIESPTTPEDLTIKTMAKGIISLKNAMVRVERDLRMLMRAQEEFTGVPPDDIKMKLPQFPFPDPEAVLAFDKQLKKNNDTGKALRSVLHTELWRSQGETGIAMMQCIMKKLFTKSVALKFVPKGTSIDKETNLPKEKFCILQLYVAVKDAVFARYPDTNPQTYEVKLGKFFAGSGDRERGREERRDRALLKKGKKKESPAKASSNRRVVLVGSLDSEESD